MNINGSLVFDASSASEIQNLRLQKVTSLPAIGPNDVGRIIYNTTTGSMHVGSLDTWLAISTGGDASALQAEIDRVEAALGLNTDGTFKPGSFTGSLADQTSYVTLITTLQGLVSAATDAVADEATRAAAAEVALGGRVDTEAAARIAADETNATAAADNADAIAAEVTRATDAEVALGGRVDTETAARIAGDLASSSSADTERLRALAAEAVLQGNIDTEATARTTGDGVNSDAIIAEQGRATDAEGELDTRITTEVADRVAAIDTVTTAIAAEVTRATGAEGVLNTSIEAEVARATAEEVAIRAEIDAKLSGLSWEAPVNFMVTDHTSVTGQPVGTRVLDMTENKIYTVTAEGFDAGEALVNGAAFFFTVDSSGYVYNGTAIVQFAGGAAVAAGTGLTKTGNTINIVSDSGTIAVGADTIDVAQSVLDSITDVSTNLDAEVTRATAAEVGVGQRVTDEIAAREAAVTAEASARTAAILVETNRALAAEAALEALIGSGGSGIEAEEAARIAADTALGIRIDDEAAARTSADADEVTNRNVAIAAEATARNTAISAAIAAEVTSRDAAILVETNRATDAETALDARIDGMYFLFTSSAASVSHVVAHNLGQKYCNVTVVDSTDNVVIPESVVFNSATQLTVTFNTAIDCKVIVMGLAPAVV